MQDGNFKAEHLHVGNPADSVWLTDGMGYMVEDTRYKEHLKVAVETKEVSSRPAVWDSDR